MSEVVRHDRDQISGAAMIDVASSLRWSRPDLTADLAGHLADGVRAADPALWLAALGWRAHGIAAVGDGRSAVVEALAALGTSDVDLAGPEGARLVVEVASACRDNGDVALGRRLARAVLARPDASPGTRLDARLVLVRCASGEQDDELHSLIDAARAEARRLPGPAFAAAVALAQASAARERARPDEAADAAAEGLRMLGAGDGSGPVPAAPHLADALIAHRLGALLETGQRAGARALAGRVAGRERTRATRQAAQLRLVLAQVTADDGPAAERALAEAAEFAAAVDCPGLEGACRVALGDLAEKQGRLDLALAATRAGLEAEHRDTERGQRFRELVTAAAERLVGAGTAAGRRAHGGSGSSTGRGGDGPRPVRAGAPSTGGASTGVSSAGAAGSDTPTRNGAAPAQGPGVGAGATSAIDALLDGLDAGVRPSPPGAASAGSRAGSRSAGRRRQASEAPPEDGRGGRRRRSAAGTTGAEAAGSTALGSDEPGASDGGQNDRVAEGEPRAGRPDPAGTAANAGTVNSAPEGERVDRRWSELLGEVARAVHSSAELGTSASVEQTPARPRQRTRATAVPIDAPDRGGAWSSGALLGDALISELRASGRWNDDDRGPSWPRPRVEDGRPGVAAGQGGRTDRAADAAAEGPGERGAADVPDTSAGADERDDLRRQRRSDGLEQRGDDTHRERQGYDAPAPHSPRDEERGADAPALQLRDHADERPAEDPATVLGGREARRARDGAVAESDASGASVTMGGRDADRSAEPRGGTVGTDLAAGGNGRRGSGGGARSRSGRSSRAGSAEAQDGARRLADLLAAADGGGRAARRRAREAAEAQAELGSVTSPTRAGTSGEPEGVDDLGRTDDLHPGGGPGRSGGAAWAGESARAAAPVRPGGAARASGSPTARDRAREGESYRAGGTGSVRVSEPGSASTPAGTSTPADGSDRTGRSGRSEPAGEPTEPSPAARAADDWLRSAIAELDRVWGKPDALSSAVFPVDPAEPGTAAQPGTSTEPAAAADGADAGGVGTSVVLDLVHGDRRIGSPEVERVLQGLTDRLRVHLPGRGRVRTGDPSTLRVDLPGRDRAETAAWLHPVLRDLAASAERTTARTVELRGARLRGTVHGTDGVTGVQLVQDLEPPSVTGGSATGRAAAGSFRMEDLAVRPGSGGRRHRRATGSGDPEGSRGSDDEGERDGSASRRSVDGGSGSEPAAFDGVEPSDRGSQVGDAVAGSEARSGRAGASRESEAGARRTAAADRPAASGSRVRPDGGTPTQGRATRDARAEPGGETGHHPATEPEPDAATPQEPPTESLGLGDLLAGAMAAYRGL
ncbi:hypothetical protein ACL02T_20565 [Pseudonocardia sp. RS010]|uniref:hypothetical protein n=1 Tax=Pseudonocardia sp. RS010 TaxID=3385979 RepID=UPI0039A1AB3E